ncbi:hypothetical protein D049_2348A, partial [Vibrio parahaemolyticus VPTS-2010]
MPLTSSSP